MEGGQERERGKERKERKEERDYLLKIHNTLH